MTVHKISGVPVQFFKIKISACDPSGQDLLWRTGLLSDWNEQMADYFCKQLLKEFAKDYGDARETVSEPARDDQIVDQEKESK